MLAAERERQGLGRNDIAQRLHMSGYQVEALEKGDYTRLPRGTFLRGFVRNYAKVLGLAPDKVLPLLDEGAPKQTAPGIVVPTQNIRFDPLNDRFSHPFVKASVFAAAMLALGFFAMYWFLFIRTAPVVPLKKASTPPAVVAGAPESAAPAPVERAPEKVAEPPPPAPPPASAKPSDSPRTAAAKAEAAKAEAAKAEAAKAEARAPAEKTVVGSGEGSILKFRFKGQSWVEIRDARGRVLLSKLNLPGSEAEVSGRPPFNVVVGNAPEVQLFYNDHEFDLEPHTKVAVARFTVE
jgi:cytoskeleton protein RodZ